jgi:hypothetical protein
MTKLTDGTYTLVPEPENESREAQVNVTVVIKDPNQSSEDQLTNPSQEGKPRFMISVFQLIQLLFLFTSAFKFIKVDWNPSCMILGTYIMNTRTRVRVDALLIGSVKVE